MKLVIFDSDGTLTPLRDSPIAPFQAQLLPGVAEKCAGLRAAGVLLAIASNQSRRRPRREIVRQLRWTQRAIDASCARWATTPRRRKPRPAMIREIMAELGCGPAETLFVGDQETDQAAAAGAQVGFAWAHDFFETSVTRFATISGGSEVCT